MPGLVAYIEESKRFDHLVFDNLTHAFSLLDLRAEAGVIGPTYEAARYEDDSTMTKNRKLLDGLALLLIKQPKMEIVATSVDITPSGVIFHWARNDNESPAAEQAYIALLLKMVQASAEDDAILLEVIRYTKEKLLGRLQKLATALRMSPENLRDQESNLLAVDTNKDSHQRLQHRLRESKYLPANMPVSEYLDLLVRYIAMQSTLSRPETLKKVVIHAFGICSSDIADYSFAVHGLIRSVRSMKRHGVKEFRSEQIFSTEPPYQSDVQGPLINAFNKWTERDPSRELIRDFDRQIKSVYQGAMPGPPGIIEISFCQHAELTLALHYIEQQRLKGYGRRLVEIGVSKAPCSWCQMWLDIARSQTPSMRIAMKESHGKRTDGWILPLYEPINTIFLERFLGQVEETYDTCINGRSDSWPLLIGRIDRVKIQSEKDFF
ncbi:MAG: hypothetical protein Q9195_004896 [Heterodermia aff. obscurata]